ncbi:type VII secretion target [Actinoplanes palleronii]|uniref:Excreted virulence factor EspC (Type VII ESX diderm) n=1 Tax=Actinoplanes palleronii TaxID=113570 RepID=A0ABQ4BKB8_9ACTN|nr:type VII secretion target [Actinoplanes palleronii]GIE71116.1 hypothetical protein Apa02nite_072240 [Actinoplanes palleronii]
MSGEQLHVETEALRAARRFQSQQALVVAELAGRVRGAATVGGAFGKLGQSNGMEASYVAWVDSEATSLTDLARMLNDIGDGLEHSADQYDGVDTSTADWMTSAQEKLP